MNREQVYQAISAGEMTFDEFEEWLSEQRHESYCDGAATQSEVNNEAL